MDRYATIVSTGRHVPPIEVPNDALRARFPDSCEFIDKMEASTGILRRWWAPDSACTSDLAAEAAREALRRAGRAPEDVDLVILGTDSPDYVTPCTSVVVQHKLGARNAGTFDVGCACASFATGLAIAAGWIAANRDVRTILVIGAYMMHKLADARDPAVFFYGDGAGAAVVEPSAVPGFVSAAAQADGAYARHWGILSGGTAEPASPVSVAEGRTCVRMIERYPPEVNHEGWPRLARTLAQRGDFSLDEVALFVFTQVRQRSIEHVMDALGQPLERAHAIMGKWGYTGSACIPMALDDAIEQGRVRRGDLVVCIGSGVGYNQAGVAFRMT
jgi:3-oxoacyl-[acyl-carrier-protein] synthase-3